MTSDESRAESGQAIPQVPPGEFANLSLTQALKIEAAIENNHEECPECSRDYEEVGIYNGGTVQFIHDGSGIVNNGCSLDTRERILEVLPYDV